MVENEIEKENQIPTPEDDNSFWKRYGPNIFLGILIVYVILLGIGTFAELTHNETILNWWIFK
jgi:hypothetical protein